MGGREKEVFHNSLKSENKPRQSRDSNGRLEIEIRGVAVVDFKKALRGC